MRSIGIIRESSAECGGIETQVCRIARELAARKIFFPVLFTSDAGSLFARRFAAMGFPAFGLPMGGPALAAGVRQAGRVMKKYDIALLQSHMFRESFFGRALRFLHPGVPHIYRVHTYIDCSRIASWKKAAYHAADRAGQRWVDRYVCISEDARRELRERSRILPGKLRVVANVSGGIGPPDPPAKPASFLPRRIAMVANFMPGKGHDVLLEALAVLKAKGLPLGARLIGGEGTNGGAAGTCARRLERQAERQGVRGQLEFYGYTPRVAEALAGIPVVVLPSDSEGMPNCLLEAMSLRKLVVASRTGGIPEIVEHGVHGLLHGPRDPGGLAEALYRVFTAPAGAWEAVRDRAYRRWRAAFSPETVMRSLADVYDELGVLT